MTTIRMKAKPKNTPWILWPFIALWRLVAGIVGLTGRLLAVILGFVLLIVGGLLSATIIGAIVGVPMLIVGFLLVLKGIF